MALGDELYFEGSKSVVPKPLLNGIIIGTLPLLIIITLGDRKFQVFQGGGGGVIGDTRVAVNIF